MPYSRYSQQFAGSSDSPLASFRSLRHGLQVVASDGCARRTCSPLPGLHDNSWRGWMLQGNGRADTTAVSEAATRIRENVARVIVGKEEVTTLLLVALLCEGHVLLED